VLTSVSGDRQIQGLIVIQDRKMPDIFASASGPLSSRTSAGIADIIRREILSGNLKPDQPLIERDIALELGVSRTPVREALFVLQGQGLVELVPRKYARIRKITYNDISQIYSLRKILEIHSAESAAKFARSEDIVEIETAIIRQSNLTRDSTAIEQSDADLAFHAAIAASSHSPILKTVAHQVLAFTATLRSRMKYDAARAKLVLGQHKGILAAIKSRDSEKAAALMSAHIESSFNYARTHALAFQNPDTDKSEL
jgi:DNA-binding GntR family transcriptional regulator